MLVVTLGAEKALHWARQFSVLAGACLEHTPGSLGRPHTAVIAQTPHRQPLSLLPSWGKHWGALGNSPGLAASWGHPSGGAGGRSGKEPEEEPASQEVGHGPDVMGEELPGCGGSGDG